MPTRRGRKEAESRMEEERWTDSNTWRKKTLRGWRRGTVRKTAEMGRMKGTHY